MDGYEAEGLRLLWNVYVFHVSQSFYVRYIMDIASFSMNVDNVSSIFPVLIAGKTCFYLHISIMIMTSHSTNDPKLSSDFPHCFVVIETDPLFIVNLKILLNLGISSIFLIIGLL